jgi:ring-1,2-phenylacetyl-CoA epoxidase subunit PaaE
MSRFYPLAIDSIRRETRDAVAVTFRVPAELKDTFRYQQGQHITLRTNMEGEDVRRSYSICSGVQDDRLRIAIKRVPGGRFSNWANEHLAPGQVVEVMPPVGHFNMPLAPAHRKHYVAFAAGSGITPVLSLVKTTLAAEPASEFTLFYGNRASSTVMFKEAASTSSSSCRANNRTSISSTGESRARNARRSSSTGSTSRRSMPCSFAAPPA